VLLLLLDCGCLNGCHGIFFVLVVGIDEEGDDDEVLDDGKVDTDDDVDIADAGDAAVEANVVDDDGGDDDECTRLLSAVDLVI
jgi:hypothetical protein